MGRKISDICLKQGQGMRGRAIPPHPGICRVPPPPPGAIPKSSTTQALIDMVHNWAMGTDGNGVTARVILFDYRKAFDLMDHSIFVGKLGRLDLPNNIINWIIDFLTAATKIFQTEYGVLANFIVFHLY